ncbi:MAG: hypothetical protein GX800_08015 [Clostridiaceae bacterium]|nr:hypothetical protein [Clostridiaceae bacterium]
MKSLLFDSHAHYENEKFDGNRAAVFEKIKISGIGCVVNVGSDIKTSKQSISLAGQYEFIYADVGVHPVAFTKKARDLRSGRFGVVLKGLMGLDWSRFSHQPGAFVLGTYDRNFVRKRANSKKDYWRYIQAYWIRNARYAYEIIRLFDYDTITAALVEDDCFEEKIYYPVALYAAMLWNANRSLGGLYHYYTREEFQWITEII